jgi:hypothetical protein
MPKKLNQTPDLFDDRLVDPVAAATGLQPAPAVTPPESRSASPPVQETKRKAGFYLSDDILERFNAKFYKLKLAGSAVDNKSALLEAALAFALDDLDRGDDSQVMKRLQSSCRRR